MLIQKIKIIVPDEVDEVDYIENEKDFIKFNLDELNRLKRKIIIYKTFDLDCKENNFFNLYLTHKDYDWKTFHYPFYTSFEYYYYISKMEYEITFNKLDEVFEFTINGIRGEKIN
jgi:hypothetical protein